MAFFYSKSFYANQCIPLLSQVIKYLFIFCLFYSKNIYAKTDPYYHFCVEFLTYMNIDLI